jgi:hypothetical protein
MLLFMSNIATGEMVWHGDGHIVFCQLNKSELQVVDITCPHENKDESPCRHDDTSCVVKWFMQTYGFECNVGVADPSPRMEIAWHFIGDRHKDLGSCQVWVIPVHDEAFSAWVVTQQ